MIIVFNGILKLLLQDPETNEKCNLNYNVNIVKDPDQYGNGCHMSTRNLETQQKDIYDIRYDKKFSSNNPKQYIDDWAHATWSGKNGSWKIVKISIEEINS